MRLLTNVRSRGIVADAGSQVYKRSAKESIIILFLVSEKLSAPVFRGYSLVILRLNAPRSLGCPERA